MHDDKTNTNTTNREIEDAIVAIVREIGPATSTRILSACRRRGVVSVVRGRRVNLTTLWISNLVAAGRLTRNGSTYRAL